MASPYGRGLTGLLKQGWHEIPAFMGGGVMGILGLMMGGYAAYKYQMSGRFDHKYKQDFIIYRSDDPRAKRLTRLNE